MYQYISQMTGYSQLNRNDWTPNYLSHTQFYWDKWVEKIVSFVCPCNIFILNLTEFDEIVYKSLSVFCFIMEMKTH